MWIYTLLILHFVLTSSLATKLENLNVSGVIKTKEKNVHAANGRSAFQNVTMKDFNSRRTRQLNMPVKQSALMTGDRTIDLKLLNRRKRGWGAVIFTGVTTLLRFGSLGVSLSIALSEGCHFFPSICENTQKIERIEKSLVTMRSEFDKLYLENKKDYLNIATANTNNAYVSFYINKTIDGIETLKEMEDNLSGRLETSIPKLYNMFNASKNYTSQEYLDSIIGRFDHRLSDIRDMLKKQRNNQLMWLVIQYLIEASANTFISAFTKATQEIVKRENSYKTFLATVDKEKFKKFWKEMKAAAVKAAKIKAAQFKMVSKGFKPIIKIREALSNFKTSVMNRIEKFGKKIENNKVVKIVTKIGKSLKHMAKKMSHSIKSIFKPNGVSKFVKGIGSKITAFKTSIKNFKVSKYNVKTAAKVMGVIGVFGDILSQILNLMAWKNTAKELEKKRKQYEEYHKTFFQEIVNIKKENAELLKRWTDVISIFQSSTSVFRKLIKSGRKYTRFNNIFGIPKLPIDTNNPIFSIQFQTINRTNILSTQEKVMNFLKDINNDIVRVVDEMRAREVMYKKIVTMTDDGDTVEDIFTTITDILMFKESETEKTFGKTLTKKDLVCTISLLRSDLRFYDFFSLDDFRPICDLNSTLYGQKEQTATKLRNENVIKDVFEKQNIAQSNLPLADLTVLIKKEFVSKNPEISEYGEKLTDKDVICMIATQFPSKQEYDFISLIPFRPACDKVSDNDFIILKHNASIARYLYSNITSTLNMCKIFKFCICPSTIATTMNTSIDQVLNLIKQQSPELGEYCGTMGCSCVNLN